MRFCARLLVPLFLVTSHAASTGATPITNLGFTSPTSVLNATLPGDQINPSVASLPGNQFVMTWSDRASLDGDRGGILGRLYDETMTPLTSEFVVNTLTADWQSKSNVASAPNGNFMAIWHEANGWVEGQLFTVSGEKQGPQFTVQDGFNGLSDVVADAQGNFWVVSSVNNGAGYVNKYSNDGELLVDSLVLPSEGVASDPVITALSDGRILVSWYDGQNPSGSDIYAQFITAEGLLSGTPFVVNTTLTENQSKSAVAALTSGGFVVAWQSLLQDGDLAGVYARVFDSTGEGGSEVLVNTNTTGNQVQAYVTARSDGGFIVGWADAAAPPQGQVYLQSYTAAGEPQGDNQVVSVDDVTTINNSVNIELAELTDGSLVAVWNAWSGSQNIYGRTFKLLTITETDSDGDGVVDTVDAFPNDPSETTDTDGDGVGDNADAFPSDATETLDSDGDGVGDNADAFPNDASETLDTDGDGVGDNADAYPNDPERSEDDSSIYDVSFTSETTLLNATVAGDQINPSIAALPGNQFVMTWSDRAGNDGDRGGIFGRLYDETMTPLTSEFVVNTLTADWQSKSNVASAPNGNFMAIWHQSNGYVEGQLFNTSGEKQGSQFTIQDGFNGLSDVVADAQGNFWVVSSVNNGSGYVSKYSNTGELLVDSLVLPSEGVASDPVITALSDGRVLVSWYDGQNRLGSDIYGQFITAEGLLSGTPFVVNTTIAENQSKPAVAALTSGGFVVVWQSLLQDGDLAGVYAQVFDAAGEGGSEILVNTNIMGNQVRAYVTARSDGGFVVGWTDAAALPQGQVYLQSYTAAGELQGGNQVVSVDNVTTINNSENLEFAELTDGSLVAVWNAWSGSQNIYGRTLEILVEQEPIPPREISFTSPTSVLNATLPGDQINPSVASLPGNQFVMTWSDRASLDGDRGGILGRLYDETMTPLTSEFVVNTLTADWQSKSNVASAPNGNFMAIWHEANGWVEGQLFTVSGEKQGPQFTVQDGFNGLSDVVADAQGNFWVVSSVNNGAGYVNKYSNDGELLVDSLVLPSEGVASDPVITALSDGRILVSWYDGQNPSGSDIYAQFITAEGLLSGTPFVVNTTLTENQSKSAVAALTSGGFVVAWQSLLQDGDLAGVYARVFDSTGEGGSEVLVNTNTTGNQVQAYVTARSDGGFIVGWADAAAPPQGQVYLQSYTAAGEPQGDNQVVSVDDVTTINNSVNIELAELTDGSLVAVWNAWSGSQNIYGRTFKLLTITETDSDGDGVVDTVDAFPNDPSETTDTDGDGVGDNADAFPSDATETLDSDGDGVGDNADAFPNDASETLDTDGDGVGDNADAYPNDPERSEDDSSIYDVSFTSETTLLNATVAGDQINPSIAALPGNQFVMTWSDRAGNDGDRGGIFGRLYDETMTPLTSEFVVNTLTADWQSKSNVASAPNGNFMAIWHQSNGYVEGQLFNTSGEKQGSQFTIQDGFNGLSDVVADAQGNFWVVSSVNNGSGYVSKYSNTGELLVDSLVLPSEGVASDPVITALSDGRVLVSWYDGQNRLGSDIYGQFITAEGLLSGTPFVVNTTIAENQSKPAVAALTSGGFVVVWQSLLQDGDLAGVYAQVFDAAGEGGSEILVNTNIMGNQVRAYVTARSDGGFVVGWTDAAALPQGQVYLQSYTAAGELQGGNQVVSVDNVTTINNSENLEFAELTDGSLVAVWNAWSGSQNIYGRTFKLQRKALPELGDLSDILMLNNVDTGTQINPGIASLPDNQFVLVYEDRSGNDGSLTGIFGGIYDSDMQLLHDCGVINTSTNSYQEFPHVAASPNGNFMVIWRNFTNTFAQRYTSSCQKIGNETFIGASFNGLNVTADSDGNFWVVLSNGGKAYLSKFDANGAVLVDRLLLTEYVSPERPERTVIEALSDGRVLVSWYNIESSESSDIYGLYVNTDGSVTTQPFVINTVTENNQIKPIIAALDGGRFISVWSSDDNAGVSSVRARIFDSEGLGGVAFAVSLANTNDQLMPYAVGRAGGAFTVGWTNETAPQDVYLQSYDSEGAAIGPSVALSVDETLALTSSDRIQLAELIDGDLVAVWTAKKDGQYDIFGRTLSALAPTSDPDRDGDGTPDDEDAFPDDPSETTDTDGDGVGDNADAFPNDPNETADSDADGVGDNADAFPNDPNETADSDADGVGDNADAFPNDPNETADSDADGVGDNADAFPNDPNETADSDADGVGDNADAFPNDPNETADSDADGVGDNADAFPNDPNETADSDADGVGDNADAFPNDPNETADSDADGVGDNADAFPNDPNETADSDADGVGDNADAFPDDPNETLDTDGDGVGDNGDAFPEDPTEDTDADGDGVGANADLDDNDPTIGTEVIDPDAIVTLSSVSAELGETTRVYLEISEIEGLNSLDASIRFDSTYLELVNVEAEQLLAGWLFQSFSPEPGLVNIATTTTSEFSGSGRLVAIDFRLIRSPEEPLTVTLESLLLNGGFLVGEAVDGNVTELIVHRVSGSVSYWSDASRALPSTVSLGDRQATITSQSSDYSIGGLETGSYVATVTIDQPDNRAIRAYDASLVLGMSVGAIEVNDVNIVAADVDKSGGVNSADARLILRYAVGLDSIPFPNQDGIWVPLPERYEYPDLNNDVTDADFIGVLVGDVSGNWKPKETASKLLMRGFGSQAITSDPIEAEVVELSENYFAVTMSLTESVEISAVELELTTSSGVSLDDWESPLTSDWVTSLSDADNAITFGATKFPAGEVQEVVTLYVATTGAGESLVSALTILDEDEFEQTLNITLGTSADSDEDGLTDAEEAELGTDPNNADSDGDGLADGIEVGLGSNPLLSDTDGDGYTDSEEQAEGTSLIDANDLPSEGGLPLYIFKAAIDAANAAKP